MTGARVLSEVPIPILIYHSVSVDPAPWIAPFTVTPGRLKAHLDRIVERGVQTLQISELTEILDAHEPLPSRSVCITIDDGFFDTVSIFGPEMAARGLRGTVFVTTAALRGVEPPRNTRLGEAPMLHWRDLPELEGMGIEIGSHSETHPPLDVIPPSLAAAEISRSKRQLEEHLGHVVRAFAYPHGFYNRRTVAAVANAGYDSAVGVRNAFSSVRDDRLSRSRLMVEANTPLNVLDGWLDGLGAPVAPFPVRFRTRAWRLRRWASEVAYERLGEGRRRLIFVPERAEQEVEKKCE